LLTWAKIPKKLFNSEWDMSHHSLRGLRAGTIAGADDPTQREAVTKVRDFILGGTRLRSFVFNADQNKECEFNWDAITHIGTENNSR